MLYIVHKNKAKMYFICISQMLLSFSLCGEIFITKRYTRTKISIIHVSSNKELF